MSTFGEPCIHSGLILGFGNCCLLGVSGGSRLEALWPWPTSGGCCCLSWSGSRQVIYENDLIHWSYIVFIREVDEICRRFIIKAHKTAGFCLRVELWLRLVNQCLYWCPEKLKFGEIRLGSMNQLVGGSLYPLYKAPVIKVGRIFICKWPQGVRSIGLD